MTQSEAELLAEVQYEIDLIETRIRSKEAIERILRKRHNVRGLPCEPTQIAPRPTLGELLRPDNGAAKLLTEAMAPPDPERERAWKAAMAELERTGSVVVSGLYPWRLPEDDNTIPTGAA